MAKPKVADPAPPIVDVMPAVYPHELPRHLHKAGGLYKHVATQADAEAAHADGWLLRPPQETT